MFVCEGCGGVRRGVCVSECVGVCWRRDPGAGGEWEWERESGVGQGHDGSEVGWE